METITIFNTVMYVNSLAIGAGTLIVALIIFYIIFSIVRKIFKPNKPKHDLHNLKKIIEDTQEHIRGAAENTLALEEFFKEIENG